MFLPDDLIRFWKIVTNEPTTDGKLINISRHVYSKIPHSLSKQTIISNASFCLSGDMMRNTFHKLRDKKVH